MASNKKATIRTYSETIQGVDFSIDKSDRLEYENCEFTNCIFSTLSDVNFIDCQFTNCNLSNMRFNFCGLQNILFKDCKLMGADCSPSKDFLFEVHFKNCNMDYTSFDKKRMNKSSFDNCKIHGANFTQADLSKAVIANCDWHDSIFINTDLSGLDFSTSRNFLIDPTMNTLKKTKFSKMDLTGLLFRLDIIIE